MKGFDYNATKGSQLLFTAKLIWLAAILLFGFSTTAADQVVTSNGDSGAGTLRQAIADVGSGETITFNLSDGNEIIIISSEELLIDKSLTIDGANTAGSGVQVTVRVTTPGTSAYRVFHIKVAGTVLIYNLKMIGGNIPANGSGIGGGVIYSEDGSNGGDVTLNMVNVTVENGKCDVISSGGGLFYDGNLTVINSLFQNNGATNSGGGGAIGGGSSAGTALITNTTFKNNAGYDGGALAISGGTCTIRGCTFDSNNGGVQNDGSWTNTGGAIYAFDIGPNTTLLTIENSTFYNNVVAANGGAIQLVGDVNLTLNSCTIFNNAITGSATTGGALGSSVEGGVYPAVTLRNNIIYGNTNTDNDSNYDNINLATPASISNEGYNIIDLYYPTTLNVSTDQIGPQANLFGTGLTTQTLANNSGPTQTLAISTGSIAIANGNTALTTDQRGYTRVAPTTIGAFSYNVNTWTGTASTDWATTGNWSGNAVPTAGDNAVIPAGLSNYPLVGSGTANAKKITMAAGAKLDVAAGATLAVADTLLLVSDATNSASFINNGTLTVTTTIVNQYLPHARNWYVSSPVVSSALPSSGFTLYNYNESTNNWDTPSVFEKGKGYIALPGAAASTLTFTGAFNSGNVDVAISNSGSGSTKGFNLIGNPYPCHLTWTKTFVDNNTAKILPTIWSRTNAGTANNSGQWSFKTYNASTGEASPAGTTGIIPPMQAFWVKAADAGTLTLNSDLTKSHQSSNPLKVPAINNTDRKRLRLQVSNGTNTDETLMYFDAAASNNFDRYDSPKMFVNSVSMAEIYTQTGSEKLVINGMSPLTGDKTIPLGFVAQQAGNFSISAIEIGNFDSGVKIILKDSQAGGSEFDLTGGMAYNFSSAATSASTDRFSVILRSASTTTGVAATQLSGQVYVDASNRVVLNTPTNATYSVYNSNGQTVLRGITLKENMILTGFRPTAGIYLVKVQSEGKIFSSRIVIK